MSDFTFVFRHIVENANSVKVYINDVYIGKLAYRDVLQNVFNYQTGETSRVRVRRLTFRGKSASFKYFLDSRSFDASLTAAQAFKRVNVKREVYHLALRCAMKFNYAQVLENLPEMREETRKRDAYISAYDKIHAFDKRVAAQRAKLEARAIKASNAYVA